MKSYDQLRDISIHTFECDHLRSLLSLGKCANNMAALFYNTIEPRYMRSFYLPLEIEHFILEHAPQFTIILGLFLCEFVICELNFLVHIYRM
jgi:hypothetical protein